MLFNLFVENVLVKALENSSFGIEISGHTIKNISFAEDTALISDNQRNMQLLLDKNKSSMA